MAARYLIRFDDICPTMNWAVWQDIEGLLLESGVKPILAVVPDNQDPELRAGQPEGAFWGHVRRWQARGWTIGLHGYQHRYVTREPGLVGLNPRSEFAGLTAEEQEEKLELALKVFEDQQVRPELWIAPAHSFDDTTVKVLKRRGMKVICDGFYLRPLVDAEGLLWIPQQIWRLSPRPFGLWTVCYHHNSWTSGKLGRFREGLLSYRSAITSFEEVVAAPAGRQTGFDRLVARSMLATLRIKLAVRSLWSSLSLPGAEETEPAPGSLADAPASGLR